MWEQSSRLDSAQVWGGIASIRKTLGQCWQVLSFLSISMMEGSMFLAVLEVGMLFSMMVTITGDKGNLK